jgi:hypothetical protein
MQSIRISATKNGNARSSRSALKSNVFQANNTMKHFAYRISIALLLSITPLLGQTIYYPGGSLGTSNGNVGIGTTTPAQKLTVNGAVAVLSGGATAFYDSTNADYSYILNPGSNAATQGLKYYAAGIGGHSFQTYNGGIVNAVRISQAGNVGIGTTSPLRKLSVIDGVFNVGAEGDHYGAWLYGGQQMDSYLGLGAWHSQAGYVKWVNSARRLAIYTTSASEPVTLQENGGNVGIGTIAPQSPLHVKGGFGAIRVDTEGNGISYGDMLFYEGATRIAGIRAHKPSNSNVPGLLEIWSDAGNINFLGGNVGIGTHLPTHRLSVNGTIKAKEVIVETAGWSDHVFEDDYKLASLEEVETHIREHRHLPGIPVAREVEEQGVSVGEMQAMLLAKIEELTLHAIAQEKRQQEHAEKYQELAAKIQRLEEENGRLRAAVEQ